MKILFINPLMENLPSSEMQSKGTTICVIENAYDRDEPLLMSPGCGVAKFRWPQPTKEEQTWAQKLTMLSAF